MTDNLLETLSGESGSNSFAIESQFPSHYRENAKELIDLVTSYYRFLEQDSSQATYNSRKMYSYRDVDTTLDSMVTFFKEKFLNGLIVVEDERFIVKNILDLYRRKGSKEGIELFFRLFFQSEVSVYYPSTDLFKLSESKWSLDRYIQLDASTDRNLLADLTGVQIFGSLSGASGIVDSIFLVELSSSVIPLLFLENIRGTFSTGDSIFTDSAEFYYGFITGSAKTVVVDDSVYRSSDNKVGDTVELISSKGAITAKGRISVADTSDSGEIVQTVVTGGYGYSIANTDILLSEQVLFIPNTATGLYELGGIITQTNSSGTLVTGTVVGQNIDSVGIIVDQTVAGYTAATHIFEAGYDIADPLFPATAREVIFASSVNSTAGSNVGTITGTESISVITDIIGNFIDVPLDATDYSAHVEADAQMSGTVANGTVVSLTTALNAAFVPLALEIGSISTLRDIEPGSGYFTDVFILAADSFVGPFNKQDQILILTDESARLVVGNIVTQTKTVVGFFSTNTVTSRGLVTEVTGNQATVQRLSFEGFSTAADILKEGSSTPLTVASISTDLTSAPIGRNAKLRGSAIFGAGKINSIDITDSGVGFLANETVTILNTQKKKDIENLLALNISYRDEFNELKVVYGHTDDRADMIAKRWDLAEVLVALEEAVAGTQPGLALFGTTLIGGKSLGDVDQDSALDADDALLFDDYIGNSTDATWRTDNASAVTYIETIMFPYMETNYAAYLAYGTFTESVLAIANAKISGLIATEFPENITKYTQDLALIESNGDATASITLGGQGTTAGRWTSFESQTNQKKRLQDSFFYQDFSYEIATSTATDLFEIPFKQLMHPSGLKAFYRSDKQEIINTNDSITTTFVLEVNDE